MFELEKLMTYTVKRNDKKKLIHINQKVAGIKGGNNNRFHRAWEKYFLNIFFSRMISR